jgi:tetratricopeptide (TPR) repeat protein
MPGVVLLGYIAVAIAVYFFALKLRGYNVQPAPEPAEPRRPDAAQLEREAERSPSHRNRVEAGFAWLDQGEPARALSHFELALKTHPNEREARYGLGIARLRSGDPDGAVQELLPLVERSFAYDEYGAALALAEARFSLGEVENALELVAEVLHDSERIEHAIALARYQIRVARKDEARETLRTALERFAAQSDDERRRNGAVATEARRMLRTLATDQSAL